MTEDMPTNEVPGRWPGRAATAVVAAFLLAALPFALWQVMSNSDEARYTVAAARMIATGDYVIPYAAWGEVRLLKPPLTYYYVVAGFSLFGQSVFGAKSMWLLSAALILGVTWALARGIGATRTGAALALTALAANPLFWRGAVAHNPDIPLTLGIAVALLGFVRLVSDDRPPAWAVWAAWLGTAWAVFAKGLLALVLVVLALGLRAAHRRLRPGRREIAALALAVVAVGWWYVLVAVREPAMFWEQFLGDQVTEKAAAGAGAARGLLYFAGFLALSFAPILIAAVPARIAWRRPSPAVLLLGIWTALNVVIFSFSVYQVPRYLLPALPAAAALIGLWLGHLDAAAVARRAGRAVRVLLLVTAAVVGLTVVVVYAGGTILAALATLAGGVVILAGLWWLSGRSRPEVPLALLALVLPLSLSLSWPGYRVVAWPAAADHGLEAVREADVPPERDYVLLRWHLLERIGLREPPMDGYLFSEDIEPALLDRAEMVLTIYPQHVEPLRALGWEIREERGAPEGFSAGEAWRAVRERDIAGLRAAYGEPIFIATRADTAGITPSSAPGG